MIPKSGCRFSDKIMLKQPMRGKRPMVPTRTMLAGAAFLMLAATQAGAIDIKVLDDKDDKAATVVMTGSVAAGDGLKVRATIGALAATKAVTVQLDFAGGNRTEAMSIGQFFHRTRIRTVIPAKARCLAPCP